MDDSIKDKQDFHNKRKRKEEKKKECENLEKQVKLLREELNTLTNTIKQLKKEKKPVICVEKSNIESIKTKKTKTETKDEELIRLRKEIFEINKILTSCSELIESDREGEILNLEMFKKKDEDCSQSEKLMKKFFELIIGE